MGVKNTDDDVLSEALYVDDLVSFESSELD